MKFSGWNRKFRLILMILILSVLAALLSEKPKWVSDGTITIPVKIFVFDAASCRPIANAECAVFHASPILDANSLMKDHPICDHLLMKDWPQSCRGRTDETGSTSINHT